MRVRVVASTEVQSPLFEYWYGRGGECDAVTSCDLLPEFAGRVCYDSFANPRPGGNPAYLEHIRDVGHTSILEHASLTFLIENVSRSVTHELVRHRVGTAFSQESQRYVDQSEVDFIVPPALDDRGIFDAVTESCRSAYVALMSRLRGTHKQRREAARSVLPNATPTTIVVTMNLRALRHFITLRASSHADAEIRGLAVELFRHGRKYAPNVFADMVERDGVVVKFIDPTPVDLETARRRSPRVRGEYWSSSQWVHWIGDRWVDDRGQFIDPPTHFNYIPVEVTS